MKEIWKDIKGYEGYYSVSNLGRVKSLGRYRREGVDRVWKSNKIILKWGKNRKGYCHIVLCKEGKRRDVMVHRLVAGAFIPNFENKSQVNHKDGNTQNNEVTNLEWATGCENLKHYYRELETIDAKQLRVNKVIGKTLGEKNFSWKGKIICLETGNIYSCASEVSKFFGISRGWVSGILNKKYGYKSAKGLHFEYYKERG